MLETIITLIPIAIGFALSPVPIVELILVLFSRRRVANSITFVIALMVATAMAVIIGAAGGQAAGDTSAGPSTIASIVIGGLGLLLLAIGVKNWRNRSDTSEPKILSTIYEMGPVAVAVLAIGISLFNPKNLPLLLAAGATIGSSSAPLVIGIAFIVIATLPYLVAALYSLLGGDRAAARLERFRSWLIAKNRLIMGVLCLALGLVLIVKAVSGLLG